ncbi:MAG TPA: response regulator [Gammaproteobacteria bacterium]|nr:response regulator [Gammaproteobacteria bacterium]
MAKILIVDDNLLNLELTADILGLAGYKTVTASSGKEGIEKAEQTNPDLILMDLRMPGMSGLEAMLKLQRGVTTCDIPVAVLTASVMKGDKEKLLNSGFYAYLQKPIDASRFPDQVAALLSNKSAAV